MNFENVRISSEKVDRSTGILCDQIIILTGVKTSKLYPEKIRRIKYFDSETKKILVFLTNNFTLPA